MWMRLFRYRNQYPILGLLGDDYQYNSPITEDKTIIIEWTGEMIKQVTKVKEFKVGVFFSSFEIGCKKNRKTLPLDVSIEDRLLT